MIDFFLEDEIRDIFTRGDSKDIGEKQTQSLITYISSNRDFIARGLSRETWFYPTRDAFKAAKDDYRKLITPFVGPLE